MYITNELRDRIVEIARAEAGKRFAGDDNDYAKGTGGVNKLPWCAYFVNWVFDKLDGNDTNIKNNNLGGDEYLNKIIGWSLGKGLAQATLPWFKNKGNFVRIEEATGNKAPEKGDIVYLDPYKAYVSDDKYVDHVGIVTEVDTANKKIKYISGNTNNDKGVGDYVYESGWLSYSSVGAKTTRNIAFDNKTLSVSNAQGENKFGISGFGKLVSTGYPPDQYESNDTKATATTLVASEAYTEASLHTAADVDWYKINLENTATNSYSINFQKVYDEVMEIHDGNGNKLVSTTSLITSLKNYDAGTYYIKVSGSAVSPGYKIRLNQTINADQYENNDTLSTATVLSASNVFTEATLHKTSDVDWYKINIDNTETNNYSINFSKVYGEVMEIHDSKGNKIVSTTSLTTSLQGYTEGTYYIKVSGTQASPYKIRLNKTFKADRFENNNTISSATNLNYIAGSSNSLYNLTIHNSTDVDYYKITLTEKGTAANFISTFNHSGGDLDLKLLNSGGTVISSSTRGGISGEYISLSGFAPGTYYANVYAYNNTSGSYGISWNVSSPVNSSSGISSSGGVVSNAGVISSGGNIAGGVSYAADRYESNNTSGTATVVSGGVVSLGNQTIHNSTDVDYYKITLTEKGTASNFISTFNHSGGDLDLQLLDSGGTVISSSTKTTNNEYISLSGLIGGTYYAKVYGYNGATGAYGISWNVSSPVNSSSGISSSGGVVSNAGVISSGGNIAGGVSYAADRYESNNTSGTATVVSGGVVSLGNQTIHNSTDVDYYKITLTEKGTASNFISTFNHSGGDLDLQLLDSGGIVISSSTKTTNNEYISLSGLIGGTYYAKVYGYSGATGAYGISWNVSSPLNSSSVISSSGGVVSSAGVISSGGNIAGGVSYAADRYESNNTSGTATVVSGGVVSLANQTIHNSTDEDYFKIILAGKGTASNYISTYNHSGGDLDLLLVDGAGQVISRSMHGSTYSEYINLDGLGAGTYYAKVYGYKGTTGAYGIAWNVSNYINSSSVVSSGVSTASSGGAVSSGGIISSGGTVSSGGITSSSGIISGGASYAADRYERNNTRGTATIISGGTARLTNLTINNANDVDYFKIKLTGREGSNNFVSTFSHSGGDLDLALLDSAGVVVASSVKGSNRGEYISLNGLASGTYYAKVYGFNGAIGTYGISWKTGGEVFNQTLRNSSRIVRSGQLASKMTISRGGKLYISSGGSSYNARILSGGVMYVYKGGSATATNLCSGGAMYVYKGGSARATNLRSGGILYVSSGGFAGYMNISSGGTQHIKPGGDAYNVFMSGGRMIVSSGGKISTLIASAGARLDLHKGAKADNIAINGGTLSVGNSTFYEHYLDLNNTKVIGGNGTITIKTSNGFNLGGNVDMKNRALNISAQYASIAGNNNGVRSLATSTKTTIYFILDITNPASAKPMLAARELKSQKGKFNIRTSFLQKAGVYKLSTNLAIGASKAFKIEAFGYEHGEYSAYIPVYKDIGSLKQNGPALSKYGVRYALKTTGKAKNMTLTITAITGAMRKGTTKADNLKGTANCDVFYGGKGNDKITGNGGRDIAVYDKTNWGKDTINKTSGTMTIVFAGLTAKNISTRRTGSNMIITRKGVSGQSITVKGWNGATHNIIYGGTMGQFSKYVSAARPTANQQTAARKEVWKKAGLLA